MPLRSERATGAPKHTNPSHDPSICHPPFSCSADVRTVALVNLAVPVHSINVVLDTPARFIVTPFVRSLLSFSLQRLFTLQYSTPPAQFLTFSDSDDAHVGQRVCIPLF